MNRIRTATFSALAPKRRLVLLAGTIVLLVLAWAIGNGISNGIFGGASAPSSSSVSSGSSASAGAAGESSGGADGADAASRVGGAGAAPSAVNPEAPQDGAQQPAAEGKTPSAGGASTPLQPMLVRTAWLGTEVTNLVEATGKARSIAGSVGGMVTSENIVTSAVPAGADPASIPGTSAGDTAPYGAPISSPKPAQLVAPDHAELTLRVPADRLDAALTQLSGIGTVSYRSSNSQDVTSDYVDSSARLATMRASVERVRALMAEAKDLTQVTLLETELTRREGDLESLQQQVDSLKDRSAMSTVNLSLWTAGAAASTPEPDTDNALVAGLKQAWSAMSGSLVAILVGLAALAPWLFLGGLVAVGYYLFQRRSARRRAAEQLAEQAAREQAGAASEEPQPVGAVSGPGES